MISFWKTYSSETEKLRATVTHFKRKQHIANAAEQHKTQPDEMASCSISEISSDTDVKQSQARMVAQNLQRENDCLRRRNQCLQDALAFAGHEWRNQIARLSIAAERLSVEPNSTLSARQQEALEHIQESAGAMRRIANNYLNLARLEGQGFVLRPSYVEIVRETLSPLLAYYSDSITERGLTCQIKIARSDTLVWADKGLFGSIWDNLLDNAIKYGGYGGKIMFSLTERGTEYEFSVWNSGQGVPVDQTERIFERFVSGTNLTATNGTGIGLYLARKIVEAHEGRMWVESQPGMWANFVFTLPRRETGIRSDQRRSVP